jgi:hypothetical protein
MEKLTGRHDTIIKEFVRKAEPGEDISDGIKVVKLTREGVKFLGFLMGNSIILPLSSGDYKEDAISQVVARNLHAADANSKEIPEVAVCHLLGLGYNSRNEGLFSDGAVFSEISAIHLYPGGYIEDQNEFIKFASEQLKLAGTTLTVFKK